ncbi:MAG: preprotein translocase subunit SecA [Verrucomicrobiia bacterium]|jgi:preprotein translocase subunit SecA
MIKAIINKIFGSKNEREVKKLEPMLLQINEIEESYQKESEDFLREKTASWQKELSEIKDEEQLKQRLDEILPDAFAVVKNACRRLCGTDVMVRDHPLGWEMIPYDVQLTGGWALHNGRIAEMATGEGKTLVGTLPVYLNALTGRGVHLVTVNDYLAARDSEWMGAVYRYLGLTVGCIQNNQRSGDRREQYECDITYGTNSEFGFDYLRDNGMAMRAEDQVQRGHYFAIVDEVDSILIDEARTPLIISGPAVANSDNERYVAAKPRIEALIRKQRKHCEQYLDEAKKRIAQLKGLEDGKRDEEDLLKYDIGLALYKVKQGQPKSQRLMSILEDPDNLMMMTKAELQLLGDQTKKELYAQKEELYFAIDEKSHDADLTEKGRAFMNPNDPEAFMLPDISTEFHEIDQQEGLDAHERAQAKAQVQEKSDERASTIHVVSQLLKGYCLYEKDVQYVVEGNKVVIVDENTGRKMPGRRWSDGLHMAVESKEGVELEGETQTLATITIQNYFRLYHKLAGMTGTAETEASEFLDIYKLGVLVIPTNRPIARDDFNDTVYKTGREKFNAVVEEIREIHKQGRPILVGTISVEISEQLSRMLKRAGVVHSVLNAKFHEKEAEIVARAGQKGAVTIATNMAGRGTDIKLAEGVQELGGLHVLGTERHDSRRIDRQLRGRCARQGDNGSSHFFISLEDNLMRLFGSDRIGKIMERVGLEEGQELEHPMLNHSIGSAQKRVEGHNFQIRKRTLEYDDVMNKQRCVVYEFRNEIIRADNVHDRLMEVIEEVILQKVEEFAYSDKEPEEWNIRGLADWVNLTFPIGIPEEDLEKAAESRDKEPPADSLYDGFNAAQYGLCVAITNAVKEAYEIKASVEEPESLTAIERYLILAAIDQKWQEHLYEIDSLRTSIGLRAYGQRDPLIEFKSEAFRVFDEMMVAIKTEICHNVFLGHSSREALERFRLRIANRGNQAIHEDVDAFGGAGPQGGSDMVAEAAAEIEKAQPIQSGPKVGRNDPCPCGSGKKYKKCCGRGE